MCGMYKTCKLTGRIFWFQTVICVATSSPCELFESLIFDTRTSKITKPKDWQFLSLNCPAKCQKSMVAPAKLYCVLFTLEGCGLISGTLNDLICRCYYELQCKDRLNFVIFFPLSISIFWSSETLNSVLLYISFLMFIRDKSNQ